MALPILFLGCHQGQVLHGQVAVTLHVTLRKGPILQHSHFLVQVPPDGYRHPSLNPSSCGSPIVIRKNLTLTSGSVNLTIDTVEGEGSAIYVSGHVTGGSAPYKWYINNQLIATTSSSFFSHRYPCDGGGSVLGVVTSCGGSDTASYYEDCSGSGGHRMAVYPNPATTEIFISPLEMGSGQIQGSGGNAQLANSMGNELDPMVLENVELKLLDFSGNVVSEKKFTGLHENLQLDVSAFPKGIYYLKIIGKGIDETHPILID